MQTLADIIAAYGGPDYELVISPSSTPGQLTVELLAADDWRQLGVFEVTDWL